MDLACSALRSVWGTPRVIGRSMTRGLAAFLMSILRVSRSATRQRPPWQALSSTWLRMRRRIASPFQIGYRMRMVRYTRRSMGVLALFALVVSLTHSVWALCCIADAESFSAPAMDAAHHHAPPADHTGSQHEQLPSSPLHDCLHGQAGVMGGCAVVATIPTGAVVVAAVPFSDQISIRLSDTLPRILFGTDLFRPPRA